MNGYEICKSAFLRLGFDNENEVSLHKNTTKRDFEFINQIAKDLNLTPIEAMSQEIVWNNKQTEAVISGVAMLLCFIEGENNKSQIFTSIYNARRASLLGETAKIKDTLPVAEGGDTL